MAEVAEIVKDVDHVEKESDKKVVEVEDGRTEKVEKDLKPKENGKSETNENNEKETNGNKETAEVTSGTKRKSGAGVDSADVKPTEESTPEKKAKISNDEKESTNGESEVPSEGVGEAKNMSYQKHYS